VKVRPPAHVRANQEAVPAAALLKVDGSAAPFASPWRVVADARAVLAAIPAQGGQGPPDICHVGGVAGVRNTPEPHRGLGRKGRTTLCAGSAFFLGLADAK
jgi:hypothetical protein